MSWRHKTKDTVSCLGCGIPFHPWRDSAKKYCSIKCQNEYQFLVRYQAWLGGTPESSRKWLRKALTKLYGYSCSVCGITEWCSKKIVLEVEHKDGNPYNDEISNLCLICPNCHSQTPTFKGGNKGNGRKERKK